jgi:hypothetical protein
MLYIPRKVNLNERLTAPERASRKESKMKSLMVTTDIEIANFEIEAHVTKHNGFFQLTHLTLDDLDFYAEPLAAVVAATFGRFITNQQRCRVILKATADIKAIDDALDIENAA